MNALNFPNVKFFSDDILISSDSIELSGELDFQGKKVDKIVGPGNSYVVAAKKEVFGDVGIEGMIAGPSEVTIVCDKFSNQNGSRVI